MPLHDDDRDYQVMGVAEGYDLWSGQYDRGDNGLLIIEEPVVDELLGDVSGLALLDLGCGTGRHAIRLAAAGANVSAVDLSPGMLAAARAKPGADAVRFVQHDMAQALPFEDDAFDRVLCTLALEHVADLASAFAEMRRVCRPDGLALITCMHPAMMLRGVLAHFDHPDTGREVQPRSVPHETADFVNAAIDAGWRLERMVERATDAALVEQLPSMARYLDWPLLLALRFR